MSQQSQDTQVVLNVVTDQKLEESNTQLWNAMKTWVLQNIDNSNIMSIVKQTLDSANREVIGTTGTAKAQAVLNSVNAMVAAFESTGTVITASTKLSDFATLIRQIAASSYEVCLLGKSGTHYSIVEWNTYIAEHGTTPEAAVVAVITPFQSFVIGLPEITGQAYPSKQWGNTTDLVAGLYASQTGSFVDVLQNSLNFHSLENTQRMLLWYNPEVLPHATYDPDDTETDWSTYNCIRFATHAQMEASGLHLMYDQQVYIVTTDTDNTANVEYIWSGTAYVKRHVVPRFANNITGSPAAEYAWNYHPWDNDTRRYALPTINHLLMMYVYYTEINACLSALSPSTLPSGNTWSCQQSGASNAYFVTIPTGTVSNTTKSTNYSVVPVAAL